MAHTRYELTWSNFEQQNIIKFTLTRGEIEDAAERQLGEILKRWQERMGDLERQTLCKTNTLRQTDSLIQKVIIFAHPIFSRQQR